MCVLEVMEEEIFKQYDKEVVQLFKDWCDEHSIIIQFEGLCETLPARIYVDGFDKVKEMVPLQEIYFKHLIATRGEAFVLVECPPYCVEFDFYEPKDTVAMFRGGYYGENKC